MVLPRRLFYFRLGLLTLTAILYLATGGFAYHVWGRWWDSSLNSRAWEAAYRERGVHIPASGPREGYGGSRLGKKIPDAALGWHEPEIHLPGLVEIDHQGLQSARSALAPRFHILIVGASVAFGAYASALDETYFVRLIRLLEQEGLPVQITVLASGAWTSANEWAAVQKHLVSISPDVVVFLNGLNDFTQQPNKPEEERVTGYLDHMGQAYRLARDHDVFVVYALQPFLLSKKYKTPLEQRIIALTDGSEVLARRYPQIRAGLADLAKRGETLFIDLSGAFDYEPHTSFADIWHFADPGHLLVAKALAEPLARLLRARAGEQKLMEK